MRTASIYCSVIELTDDHIWRGLPASTDCEPSSVLKIAPNTGRSQNLLLQTLLNLYIDDLESVNMMNRCLM